MSIRMFGKLLIYSDLDGTLLDERYSFTDALPALDEIKKRKIPLVFCTSKTRAEIEFFMNRMDLDEPFISENGGAVFIPEGYFHDINFDRIVDGYCIIELGTAYEVIRKILREIQSDSGCSIRGFGDMTVEEVMDNTGLDREMASLSKKREYDEPFVLEGDEGKVLELIEEKGLRHTRGGLFYHALGDNDKGRAVGILTEIFRVNGFSGETVGLGDSFNDFPLLGNVDVPVLVRGRGGNFPDFEAENLIKTDGVGPVGWSEAVLDIIEKSD